MENMALANSNIESFVEFLYGGLEGYVYLAACDRTLDPKDPGYWKQEFFKYPEDKSKLSPIIKGASASLDVYLAPAIYKRPSAESKEDVKASNVVWTEFDGNAPDWTDDNRPSLIIQTSSNLNQHVYWRLNEPITNIDRLEEVNRNIMYNMGADSSAWDATQVLRPPDTINHKRSDPENVYVTDNNHFVFDISVFDTLAPAPPMIDTPEWGLSEAADLDSVLLSYSFGPDLVRLLKATKEDIKDRSASLMNLAYGCAQMGMHNNEIMSILISMDDRWEKFKGRKDRLKRLSHIIVVARNKYPEDTSSEEEYGPMVFGFQSLIDTEISVDWLVEPFLIEQGNMLFVGPSGVGKTQITVQFLIHMCLGKDFLHYKIHRPLKILFLSLEMGHGELKFFLEMMRKDLTDEEAELLDKNLLIVPHGEPWALNTPVGQEQAIQLVEMYKPDGFVVDSIGSAVKGVISSDEAIQPITEFNDKIRKRYNLFTWYIHHTRKAKDSNHQLGQDDVYGNQYLFNRATSCYLVTRGKEEVIKVDNLKHRLAMREEPYLIKRTANLNFEKAEKAVDGVLKHYEEAAKASQPKGANNLVL